MNVAARPPKFGKEKKNEPLILNFEACDDALTRMKAIRLLQRSGYDLNEMHEIPKSQRQGKIRPERSIKNTNKLYSCLWHRSKKRTSEGVR